MRVSLLTYNNIYYRMLMKSKDYVQCQATAIDGGANPADNVNLHRLQTYVNQ